MVDRFIQAMPPRVKVDDARQIARAFSELQGLPPGFELDELIEDLGGELARDRPANIVRIGGDSKFRIELSQKPEIEGREAVAEMLGMFVLLAVARGGVDKAMAFNLNDCEKRGRELLSAFARELLVPGRQLTNLAEFYGLRGGQEWKSRDVDFLALLFEVTRPCMELRLSEQKLLVFQTGANPGNPNRPARGRKR